MGTSKSAAEFAGKMNRVATTIPRATRAGVSESALRGKTTVISIAAQRGVRTTSRIARGKWSVGYDVKGTANPSALLRIRGPFQLVENDTRAHTIPRSRRRRNRKKAVAFNGVVRRTVQHPGTRGKHIFRDAKKRIVAESPPAVMRHVVLEMSQALR